MLVENRSKNQWVSVVNYSRSRRPVQRQSNQYTESIRGHGINYCEENRVGWYKMSRSHPLRNVPSSNKQRAVRLSFAASVHI